MNWKHGLIRLWALTSILWLLVVSYLASGVFFKPLPFQGDYQYVVQTKEMPWNIEWNKPYYETCYAPGNGRFPETFATVDEQYTQQFDEGRKAGKLALIEFPDNSRLYMCQKSLLKQIKITSLSYSLSRGGTVTYGKFRIG